VLVAHCGQVGEALARLHLAVADFPMKRANALSVPGWKQLYQSCQARADEVQPGLARELGDELEELTAKWPKGLPEGVIHADLFPDNVFFVNDKLSGVIDFYFACNDALAYDLGICLNAWCFEKDGALNATKARSLVRGYRKTRPVTAEEIEALPILARGSALRFLLTRLYDWLHHPPGAFVQPKDPLEYLKKLRFHRSVKSASAYGL
jgi:homoserine kinase type II